MSYKPTELILDSDDYTRVKEFTWYVDEKTGYWCGTGGVVRRVPMHEFIMGKAPKGFQWDHIDLNKNNNSRSNLRLATISQQHANVAKYRGKYSSQYKGVYWFSERGKWRARIKVMGRFISLGVFDSEEDAALAYDKAAKEHFGEFARTNF